MTKLLAMVVLLALGACSRADERKAAGPLPGTLPGTLTKPIDQYSGDELYAFAHGLTFAGGVERQRRCRGSDACRGAAPGQRTRVRVDAVDQQDSLSANAVPSNGVIAVRANNTGALADSLYDMQPGGSYEYYLIVLPGNGGRATWRLEELDTTQGKRAHRSVATGVIRECNHPFQRGARADFKTCASAITRPASFSGFQNSPEEPIWYGCSADCCTADPNDERT